MRDRLASSGASRTRPHGPTFADLREMSRAALPVLHGFAVVVALVLVAALGMAIVPKAFGMETLVVSGGSMGGAVRNGSIVVARWTDAEDVEPGDIIVARRAGDGGEQAPVLHRVVSVEHQDGETIVHTKGDANSEADPDAYVLPERVSTPLYIIPFLGYAVAVVATPAGWTLLIGIPGLCLCLLMLHAIWSDEPTAATGPRRSARHEPAPA